MKGRGGRVWCGKGDDGGRGMVEGRGGGDSDRYSQGALKSTTNDECYSSFG